MRKEMDVGRTILLTGIHGMLDNGEVALLIGAVLSLRRQIPDAHFCLGVINGRRDEVRLGKALPDIRNEIKLIRPLFSSSARLPWYVRTVLLLPQYILAYVKCDIGVHIGADGYTDAIVGGPLSTITHSYQLLLGHFLRKPVVACAQSIGPFNTSFTRFLSRFTLNRVSLITVRERVTQEYLKRLGVAKPPCLVADLAFLVEPSSGETVTCLLARHGIPGDRPLACLAPSQIVHNKIRVTKSAQEKYELYIETMAGIVDHLATKGLDVILLCQTVGGRHDDTVVAGQIRARAQYKPWIMNNDLSPQDLKGIMGRCELMVSSKMHSAVLATSMGTPTVVIGYHPKVHGIIGDMMRQEDFIVDIATPDFPSFQRNLRAKIELCLNSRDKIRSELQERIPEVRRVALRNAELIANIMEKRCKQSSKRAT